MEKMTAALKAWLGSSSLEVVDLVVHTRDDSDQNVTRLQEFGFRVRHRLRLLPGMAVTGQVDHIPALLKEAWVVSIEEDRPVAASSEGTER